MISFSVWPILLALTIRAEEAPKYPYIDATAGDAQVQTGRDGKPGPAKAHQLLRETALLVTGKNGVLKIQMSASTRMELRPGTKVELPGISWENGAIPEVRLTDGRLRWVTERPEATAIKTPLYELTPPGGDYLIEFDRAAARGEVQVLKGELAFGATNAEDIVKIKVNQKASFQGLLQDGEIAYDVLLKGRRIPRGTLSPASALTDEDLKPFREAEVEASRTKQEREKSARAKAQAIAKSGTICKTPPAHFNECAWTCEGLGAKVRFAKPKNSSGKGTVGGSVAKACPADDAKVNCVRRRCNANGQWTDAFTLPADEGAQRCGSAASVALCDY